VKELFIDAHEELIEEYLADEELRGIFFEPRHTP